MVLILPELCALYLLDQIFCRCLLSLFGLWYSLTLKYVFSLDDLSKDGNRVLSSSTITEPGVCLTLYPLVLLLIYIFWMNCFFIDM